MAELIIRYKWLVVIIILWTLPWKGLALWRAAKNNQKIWFVLILLLNTLAILDIIYLFRAMKYEENQEAAILHQQRKKII